MPDQPATLLSTHGLTKEFRGFAAVQSVDLTVRTGHRARARRARTAPARPRCSTCSPASSRRPPGTIDVRRRATSPAAAGADRAPRHRPVVPDHQPVRPADRARARRARARQPDRPGLPLLAVSERTLGRFRDRADGAARPGRARRPRRARSWAASPTARSAPSSWPSPWRSTRKLLLLDEPTAGMGLEDVDRTIELVLRIAAGRTVVFVDHNMHVVGSLADRVTVLQQGEVLVEGHATTRCATTSKSSRPTWEQCRLLDASSRDLVRLVRRGRACSPTSSLTVGPGEVVTLVGRNGAGKTTLLRCVMGLHRQIEGTITVDGTRHRQAVAERPRPRRHRLGARRPRHLRQPHRRREPHACRPSSSDSAWSLDRVYESFPVLARAPRLRRAPSSPAASSRCSPSPGCCGWARGCCCCDEPSEGLAPVIVQHIGDDHPRDQGRRRRRAARRAEREASPPPSPTGTTCSPRAAIVEQLATPSSRPAESELLEHLGHLSPPHTDNQHKRRNYA